MRWLLIILLIFVIMLIAYSASEQYKEKFDFYNNLKKFLNQFKLNLSFRQEKIFDFLNKTKFKKQFNIFIREYKVYLKTTKLNLDDIKILDDEEKNEIRNIVNSIGNLDATNEIKQLDTFILEIEDRLKKAESEKSKLCPMIIKLSLLFAIGISIILV